MSDIYDVAVVGYGPTGMVAASLLGQLGHRVLVIERWPDLYGLPRLTHIDDETARAVQAAADVSVALRDSSPTSYVWTNGTGQRLLELPAPPMQPMGYPTHISMYQPDVEAAVDARVREQDNVDIRRGWSVTRLANNEGTVSLTMSQWPTSGDSDRDMEVHTTARYVIAADGSKSAVRTLLGVDRDDFGFNERWVNVDVEWLVEPPVELAGSRQVCDPARGRMTMRIGQRRQRFEFALLPHEDIADMNRDRGLALIEEYFDVNASDVKVVRDLVYTFEARIAQSWRVGNVFLAGDAAHTMPPYLGQGACSGIRDANNLAWKLHMVLGGAAADELLDTYEAERRPHATVVTHMALGLGQVANMHDPEAAAQRDAAFMSGNAPPPPSMPTVEAGVVEPSSGGILTPQGTLTMEGRTGLLDDLVGYGFVLVCRTRPRLREEDADLLTRLGCSIVPLDEVEDASGLHTSFLDQLGAFAYVARPDFVLFGTAHAQADLTTLIASLATKARLLG